MVFSSFEVQVFLAGVLFTLLVVIIFYYAFLKAALNARIDRQLRERKDQFVALGSHYLLNPISIIQSAIATLQEKEGSLSSEQREKMYEAIVRGQQRLWILAEQLALVGEIDQNDLRLNVTISDLEDVVTNAIAAVDSFARVKKIQIKFEDRNPNVGQARFDARRLRQVIIAVLDNAIKFSLEESTIVVVLSLEKDIITIMVRDFGVGMPEEIIGHLSEKFYRGTSLYNYDYEGLGLGLHVAQAIMQLHQGVINFRSIPKQGTEVLIQFPNL